MTAAWRSYDVHTSKPFHGSSRSATTRHKYAFAEIGAGRSPLLRGERAVSNSQRTGQRRWASGGSGRKTADPSKYSRPTCRLPIATLEGERR